MSKLRDKVDWLSKKRELVIKGYIQYYPSLMVLIRLAS